ncbi:MAG: 50S ribosomal protein L11 methyltransferase [Leptolyngbya sp. IPPAS B-1204]|nr:MAG: 50S ribosomal protein L11 methyltransferase [Leptolyngbya sp. IPPAS B-1204]
MTWLELNIEATPDAVDWVCTLLRANDEAEVQITALPLATELPSSSDWAYQMRLYLPYTHKRTEELRNLLSPLQRTGLISPPEIAFVDQKPAQTDSAIHRVGERFVVLNSDASYRQQADEIPLRLDNNLAFGSGFHPATFLSLQLLERYVEPQMQALDLGSGSGILSVAMATLGADVLALDNDATAVKFTGETVRCNHVASQVTVMQGSLGQGSELGHWMGGESLTDVATIQPTAAFNLIVANILGRVHVALANDYQRALAPTSTAILITAGFTTDYESDVNSALSDAGFQPLDCRRWNEWVALAHRL